MKNIFTLFILACAFLFSCQTMSERQLSQMLNYYIEAPTGGKIFFEKYGNIKNEVIEGEIEKQLKELGYNKVQNIKDAQFILSPHYYTEGFKYPDPFVNKADEIFLTQKRGSALNFTIRVKSNSDKFLLSCDSRIKIIPETMNLSNIKRQIEWALAYFPKHNGNIQ